MSKSVLDIQKGDDVTFVEHGGKVYIHTATTSPFTADSPATFFADNGTGALLDGEGNPIQDMTATRVHLTSVVLDNNDVILKTDGKIFNAIFEEA